MVAAAREFRETQALEKMSPEDRKRYRMQEPASEEMGLEPVN